MAIKPLNHYSLTKPASIYDEEALTALELAGRTAAKVNENVEAFNKLEKETSDHLTAQDLAIKKMNDETMPAKVADEVQDHIDNGEFDAQIDKSLGDLSKRVDNMLGSMTPGSTTRDAEIIDARVGQDGTTYANLGTALRTQLTKTIMRKTPATLDADQIVEPGFYFKGSSQTWENIPASAGTLFVTHSGGMGIQQIFVAYTSGLYIRDFNGATFSEWRNIDSRSDVTKLVKTGLTLTDANTEYDANTINHLGCIIVRGANKWSNLPELPIQSGMFLNMLEPTSYFVYQVYFNYNGGVFLRHKVAGSEKFTEWIDISTVNKGTLPDQTDLNTVKTEGHYFIGGGNTHTNLPESNGGGMLEVKYGSDTRWYQVYISATTTGYYFRNFVNGAWKEWKRVAIASEIPSVVGGSGKEYTIQKKDNTSCYIFKTGAKGLIRYEYGLHYSPTINLNVWRLRTIAYCNFNGTVINEISEVGADLEGVILLEGDSDHLGGIHGDEIMTESFLFINGKQYTFDTVEAMEADEIQVIVKSTISRMDGGSICFNKIKRTVFDRDGVHVHMEWTPTEVVNINSIRACMMSVNKSVITHAFDSNIEKTPLTVPEGEGGNLISGAKLNDAFYVGVVSVHHWAGERGGDAEKMTGFISNYGYRLKSYFTCYDNHTTTIGEKLTATNHIYITC